MFASHLLSRNPNPFHRFSTTPSSFPVHKYTSPHLDLCSNYTHKPKRSCRPYQPRRQIPFDIESSSFSDTDYDPYSLDTDSAVDDRLHTPCCSPPAPPISPFFRTVSLKLPTSYAENLRHTMLILPPSLTRLKIRISSHRHDETLCAVVAGDMPLHDVVKQLLPHTYTREARVYVQLRGEWQEVGGPYNVSDIVELGKFAMNMNERREVEIRVVVGGGGGDRGKVVYTKGMDMGRAGVKGWGRETGRMERMRVY